MRPPVHDGHAVGVARHHAQIVGDEQQRGARFARQFLDEIEDLRLHGHVQRRRRLVGNNEPRLAGERHGDHDALAHAARVLVRERGETARRIGDADAPQQLLGGRIGLAPG